MRGFLAFILLAWFSIMTATSADTCAPGYTILNDKCVKIPPVQLFKPSPPRAESPPGSQPPLPLVPTTVVPVPPREHGLRPSSGPAVAKPQDFIFGGDPPQLVPARAYLRAGEIPPPGIGAYGILALRGKPTSATRTRLMMACASFISYLPKQSELPSTISLNNQMLTIWPIDNPDAPEARADNCDYILDHYALFAADTAMHDAGRQNATFNGEGPFLIGWSP